MHFETLHYEIKCVLSIKEWDKMCFKYQIIKLSCQMDQNFHICLWSGPRGLTPPPCGQPDHKISVVGVIGGQMCWHSRLELRTPITYMKTVPSLRPCLQVLPFPFPQKSEGGPPGLDIDFPKLWNWESGLLLKDIRGSNLDQALGVRVNQSTNYLNLFSEKDDKHVRNSSPDPMV